MIKNVFAGTVALACLCCPAALLAQPETQTQTRSSVMVSAETQEFSEDQGSLRSLELEYKLVNDDTTVLFTPALGERRAPGLKETAVGGSITLYHDWSPTVSTRTRGFIAEDKPVFAQYDLAQDVTVKVADSTTATVGARLARYFGDRDVAFYSAGARRYFKFGSISYRLTVVDPDNRDAYLSHLVNLSLKDAQGSGRTQLWLSAGDASITSTQLPANFSGEDYGAALQRTQPLTDDLSLVATLGYSSYDRPGNRLESVNVGIGLAFSLD